VDTGQHSIEIDGLRRAARIAASIAGATGSEVDDIAEEAMARLLMQDGLVNNPKAWVRSTATRLAGDVSRPQRIRADEVLEELSPTERSLVLGHRSGYTMRELARRLDLSEDAARDQLAEANRKVRRSSRRLADAGR
jgi:DNA-directed RNA polymerase specialized sigma24 family protein